MNLRVILLMGCVYMFPSVAAQKNFQLLILHNNDMHARFEEYSDSLDGRKIGGFARVLTVIKQARKRASDGMGPPVLYLNAGDTFTGTVWFSVHKWKIASDFMNLLEPDAMCLGNHEFDENIDGLLPFIQNTTFPVVSANLDLTGEPFLQMSRLKPSVVLEREGVKIGVIGYLTPDTVRLSLTRNVIIDDEIEALKKQSEILNAQGVKIIIALGHSGIMTDKKIAKEVPLVDIVVGGHTNTFLWNGDPVDKEKPEGPYPLWITQKSGKRVPVVQAFAYTKYMGHLNVNFDLDGNVISAKGQPLFINNSIVQDPIALSTLEKYRKSVKELNEAVVGHSKVYLGGGDGCRIGECNFGNLITDSMIWYKASSFAGSKWTDASIAIINSGAIRNGINHTLRGGNLTKGDILGAFPFTQVLAVVTLKGSDLKETFEIGARSNGDTSRGEFLQVSGLRVTYDFAKLRGSRVTDIKVRCSQCFIPVYEDFDPNAHYKVITTTFLTEGGDGHDVIQKKGIKYDMLNTVDFDVLCEYIGSRDLIYPEIEGRLSISNLRLSQSKAVTSGVMPILVLLSVLCTYLSY